MANASQQDINMLSAWYSGWYNGLAHKHFMDYRRTKEVEQEALAYCRKHPERRIIDALAVIFKDERAGLGAEMRPHQTMTAGPAPAAPLQTGTIHPNVFSAGLIVGAGGGPPRRAAAAVDCGRAPSNAAKPA